MVFEDPGGRRWGRLRLLLILLALTLLAPLGLAVLCRAMPPRLARIPPARPTTSPSVDFVEMRTPESDTAKREAHFGDSSFSRSAFVVQDDPASLADLKRNLHRIDAVFPDWFSVSSPDGRLDAHIGKELRQIIAGSGIRVLPRLSNTDARGAWHGEILSDLFRDRDAVDELIDDILKQLQAVRADGINIDFEEVEPSDRDAYLDWLELLANRLHERKMLLTVDVPVGIEEAFDYEMIGKIADAVVLMGYDEHYPSGAAGPIASERWFAESVEDMAVRIPKQKLIAAIGAYGYDWNVSTHGEARALSFDDAIELARSVGAKIITDGDTVNSTLSYQDAAGGQHRVWLLDGVSAWNQFQLVKQLGLGGISVWRLGMEEPGIWSFFGADASPSFDPHQLGTIESGTRVRLTGAGELITATGLAREGRRSLSFDGPRIAHAAYEALPDCYGIERRGHDDARKVALTFDDGPEPVWTAQLLEVLRRHHVVATFFVVGEQARLYPDLVRKEYEAGHLIGNHTYSHPDLGRVSAGAFERELSKTQRVIEAITGRQTLLFRSPYDTNAAPDRLAELQTIDIAVRAGYVCAAGDIDSDDYRRPGIESIVGNVLDQLEQTRSNIIVMHDAGGDRSQTVAAAARLIPLLKARGYQFVTPADLLGVTPDRLMPEIPRAERSIVAADQAVARLGNAGWSLLMGLFLITTIFALLRSALLGAFVFLRSRRPSLPPGSPFTPPVLVLIPAYNEAKVIRRTIEAVLRSDYPDLRVLVVNDGSNDDTAAIVADLARRNPEVRLLTKSNGGKFSALNRGFHSAWEEYVVTIDADTLILPDTVRRLIAHFADPSVDAVCGNVQVGNAGRLLTRLQDVEYVTSQNYDRRAFDAVNCIPVVPGATGAWRRRSVIRAGGYSPDTLTEDADLTLELLGGGAKIVYEPAARSITEAPEDLRSFFKQRFRWGYGTFQCLGKHRDRFGRGALGWVALPNLLLFQVLFPALAPLSAIVVVSAVLAGKLWVPAVWLAVFVLVDLIGAVVAFALEGRRMRDLWLVLAQRLYYRPLMYAITCKSLFAALRGNRHGWNKLERVGSVRVKNATEWVGSDRETSAA
jgi:cellulose synthase/poly-beta-1,6-N-acetylglucosamine synthase-like glycosyltransferase/spore germination protein YaaH/peptidoglycan/xylan/chitin deacetylase (PgdA/CDA1 family)